MGVYQAVAGRYGPLLFDDVNDAFIRAGLCSREMAAFVFVLTRERLALAKQTEETANAIMAMKRKRSVRRWAVIGAIVGGLVAVAIVAARMVLQ